LVKLGSGYWVLPFLLALWLMIVAAVRKPEWKKALYIMLILYAVGYICVTFLCRVPSSRSRLLLTPLHTYKKAIRYIQKNRVQMAIKQVLPNVVLFVPLGLLLYPITGKAWRAFVLGAAVSLVTEVLQYVLRLGWADIDDVINNTLGLLIGLACCRVTMKKFCRTDGEKPDRTTEGR